MTAVARPRRRGALGGLAIEEKAAWAEYLEVMRETCDARYDEVEPWAWNRLNNKLAGIQSRRRIVEGPTK